MRTILALILLLFLVGCSSEPDYKYLAIKSTLQHTTSLYVSLKMSEESKTESVFLCSLWDGVEPVKQSDGRYTAILRCVHPRVQIELHVKDASFQKDGFFHFEPTKLEVLRAG